MSAVHPGNARVVRRYLVHLREAKGLGASTIDHSARAIAEYERFTESHDFKTFSQSMATEYKRHLLNKSGKRPYQLSERSTVLAKLRLLQGFLRWLAEQPGYRSRIRFGDIEYLNLPLRDVRIANERPTKPAPTLEQAQHVIRSMPAVTDSEKRDRAVVAILLLTGVRVSALISLKLKHVLANGTGIYQDAREVKTKFGKSFATYFIPVGDDIRDIFSEYVKFLRVERLWGADDALFPRTAVAIGREHQFCWSGIERSHWETPDPVRDICRRAFAAAGLPYFSPHTFRTTLTRLAEANCHTPEEWKSFSQNLGHEGVGVTFSSYGVVPERRQAELIAGLKIPSSPDQFRDNEAETAALIRQLAQRVGILE